MERTMTDKHKSLLISAKLQIVLAGATILIGAATKFDAVVAAPGQGLDRSALTDEFDRVYNVVRPYPGEYAWRDEIPWQTRIQKARELAVAQDKPIFMLASANAYALGRT